jgi:hypothetical protein
VNRRNVHVAKLRIRIPRGLAGQAADIARGFGGQILRGIAESTAADAVGRHVDAVPSVRVRVTQGTGLRGLQEQAATQVAQRLRTRGDEDSHG